jgi:hypothetical protein
MILHTSIGTLRYGFTHLVVDVDTEIPRYYRALLPKYVEIQPQMYPAHISVVRKETPPNMDLWKKYDGEKVEFKYSPIVHEGSVYFWLNVFCQRLEKIRVELGLPIHSPYTLPPEEFVHCFHCTLGNKKLFIK